MRDVVVAKLEHAAPLKVAPVSRAAVAELVQEDQVAAADERRNHADVRQVAAAEDDASSVPLSAASLRSSSTYSG